MTIPDPCPRMGLVRFPCGCVGWPARDAKNSYQALVIEHCDPDHRYGGNALSLGYRVVQDATECVPLTCADERALIAEIGRLLSQGYQLDALRSILGTAPTPNR
jgi:hypothetical protein